LLLIGILMPGALAAQGVDDSRLAGRLDGITAGRVDSLVRLAGAEGLPRDPLIQKALEGASKGASGERIVGAVATLKDAMAQARAVLGSGATGRALLAGGLSLRAGATPAMLREVARLGRGRDLDVPLGVLTDLVARGLPLAEAYASVERLVRLGASDNDLLALRDRMAPPSASRTPGMAAPAEPTGIPAPESPRVP
jgi:hypothetical protein